MRQRVGCTLFTLGGLAWLAFVSVDLLGATMGDCAYANDACSFYRSYVTGYVLWRGLAVALLLILAYVGFRSLKKDDDVQ